MSSALDQACSLCTGFEAVPPSTSNSTRDQSLDASEVYQPSSKVIAMLDNITAEQVAEPSTKWSAELQVPPSTLRNWDTDASSVIFSCWTGMLDLVGIALASRNLGFQRIDGRHTEGRRRAALEDFRSNTACTVLMASIGSAGVGFVKAAFAFWN